MCVQRVHLTGQFVELVPLESVHVGPLLLAANEDRRSYLFTPVPDSLDAMEQYVAVALDDQENRWAVPFVVVRRSDQRIVGTTRFLDLDYWAAGLARPVSPVPTGGRELPRVGEIGATWYAESAQRSAVNTECKLLLLRHGFENWGLERVSFKTDSRNARSRAAIERIGAHFEGVRRAHVLGVAGVIRNSAYYSILAQEWPDVRARLEQLLSR